MLDIFNIILGLYVEVTTMLIVWGGGACSRPFVHVRFFYIWLAACIGLFKKKHLILGPAWALPRDRGNNYISGGQRNITTMPLAGAAEWADPSDLS